MVLPADERALLEGLFEFAPDAIVVVDREGRIVRANARVESMFGWRRDEVVGRPVDVLVPERLRGRHAVLRQGYHAAPRVRAMGPDLDLRGARRDGSEFPIEIALGPLATAGGPLVLAIVRDVTHLRASAHALRDSEARLQAILDNAPAVIYLKDPEGRYLLINRRYEELFGVRRAEVRGRTDLDLWPREAAEAFMANDRHVLAAGGPIQFEETAPHADGPRTYVSVKFPLCDAAGAVYAVCGISTDITDRKLAEQALARAHEDLETRVRERTAELGEANRRLLEEQGKLIQAEKLSSIGLLAAGVAHEVYNPLAGVMACLRALEADRVGPDRRAEYFETVRDGLERIQGTVRGLLDYARARTPSRTELDAAEVVAASFRLVAPAAGRKRVQLSGEVEPGRVRLLADRSQILQALVNVLLNAVHAAPDGSRVAVSALKDGARAGLRVTDQGPGIPAEVIDRVCDPFFTTKPEGQGTGLGLAVTLGLVRGHGGDLAIESRPGQGTSVTLWLPRADAPGW